MKGSGTSCLVKWRRTAHVQEMMQKKGAREDNQQHAVPKSQDDGKFRQDQEPMENVQARRQRPDP